MIYIIYKIGEIIVVILHIYGDRAIPLLFYDDQDNAAFGFSDETAFIMTDTCAHTQNYAPHFLPMGMGSKLQGVVGSG